MNPELQQKVTKARELIRLMLTVSKRPCVLWSGGKDSMVLLHLQRSVTKESLPVVCWREPYLPAKQAFVNRMIAEWNIEAWDYAPSGVALCQGNGRVDVMNHYSIGTAANPNFLILARGTERPEEGKPWLCGRDTFLSRPLGSFEFPWDMMFHGHKSVDVDPCSGAVPLQLDLVQRPGNASAVYPLRDWSDEDVFSYIESEGVPYDETRYRKTAEGWEILPDKHLNADYYHTCVACLERGGPEFVQCPKTGLTINNISQHVRWIEPKMEYCSLRTAQGEGK